MQVAERDIVDTAESARGNGRNTADRDGAFGITRLATDDEGVRENDRPGLLRPGREILAHPAHRLAEYTGMSLRLRHSERVPGGIRLQIGDSVERDRPVGVIEQNGPVQIGDRRAQVQATGRGELAERAESRRRVVVCTASAEGTARS